MRSPSPLEAIFFRALEKPSHADRVAFLKEACAENHALRVEVEQMLAAQAAAGNFLESPAPGLELTNFEPSISEGPGTVIGPYKLLEQIGEGGMGVVFMAEQSQPIQRRVALKIIKPGMDTRQIIARFEAERQALALMDHPNIARVLDAGATDAGRPYIVMELVRGVPLTEFCDRNNYSIRQRLELFVDVCQAVQHAHQKGIIHRDIKPTNVLVTLHDGKPVIKVIDFGVAKATGQKLTEKTLFTGFAEMVGTPLYMSPEQAELSGLDVDTRSDIYSMGVLLYELLTGHTPFDSQRLKSAAFDEFRRIIREDEPPRPSTRISTLAQQDISTVSKRRSCDPRHLSRLFQGELDWIVMKSLEKDRNRRYETASALAADVERYLHDEPVEACPPSIMYRFRKFVRRNRLAVVGSVLVTTTLLIVAIAIVFGAGWVMRDRAIRQSAVKLNTIGVTFVESAMYEDAERAFRDAIRVQPDYYESYVNLSRILIIQGRFKEVEETSREATRLQPDDYAAHCLLATSLVRQAMASNTTPPVDEAATEFAKAIDSATDTNHHSQCSYVAYLSAQSDEVFDRLLQLRPNKSVLWIGRAHWYVQHGRWADAAANYAKAIHDRPIEKGETTEYAYLLLQVNDAKGYHEFCEELLKRHGEPRDENEAFNMARACAAGSSNVVDPQRLVRWASQGAEKHSDAWFPHVLGLSQYRAGYFDAAIKSLEKSNSIDWQPEPVKAQNWLVLAMAHYRMGHTDDSRQCLEAARKLIADALSNQGNLYGEMLLPEFILPTPDWIAIQVFSREAEALLKETMSESTPQSNAKPEKLTPEP